MESIIEKITKAGDLRVSILDGNDRDAELIAVAVKNNFGRCTTRHAVNKTEFVQLLESFNPDIVVSDFCFPDYDGFAALDEVRKLDKDIPFIFVSSVTGEGLAIEALRRGVTDCINKNHLLKLASALQRTIAGMDEHHNRIRAEVAIERLRRRNLRILDSADEGIAALDGERRFMFMNRAGFSLLGYDIRDLLNESITLVIADPAGIPDDAVDESLLGNPTTGTRIIFIKKMNGEIFPAEYTINSVDDRCGTISYVLSFRDISRRQKAEEDLAKSYERMRNILFESIPTLSSVVEFRDPYTAGHQKRVAELAAAISHAMGLPPDQIDGIFLSAIVHDIGKISVPAEILTRPGKLSDLEFAIIRGHAETGYLILKDIDYPWPITQAVHQHHEVWAVPVIP